MIKDKKKEFTSLECIIVEYTTVETNLYSDFYSIRDDLDFALDAINRSLKHLDSTNEDTRDIKLLRHHFTSALNYYYRGFAAGKRRRLDPNEVFDDKEYKKAHEHLTTYRSKYVAHRVNNFEEGKMGIVLSDRDPNKAIVLNLLHGFRKLQYYTDLAYQLNWLKGLIFKCFIFIENELKLLQKKILSSAQKNIKEVCNNPELVITCPDLTKVKVDREYYSKK